MPIETGRDAVWDSDRVAQLLRHYVLPSGAQISRRTDWPDEVILRTREASVVGSRATWLVGREPWVRYAVRAVEDRAYIVNTSVTHGFVLARDSDEVVYLNDVAAMRALGGRVGEDLDPIAYAELLAELYSGPPEDGPVVRPTATTPEHPAGELVTDVARFHARYEFVAPALLAAPTARRADGQILLQFCSGHYYITGLRAIDILRWQVRCGGGRPATWRRDYVVQRLEAS